LSVNEFVYLENIIQEQRYAFYQNFNVFFGEESENEVDSFLTFVVFALGRGAIIV
jgi:hypothetical protein